MVYPRTTHAPKYGAVYLIKCLAGVLYLKNEERLWPPMEDPKALAWSVLRRRRSLNMAWCVSPDDSL